MFVYKDSAKTNMNLLFLKCIVNKFKSRCHFSKKVGGTSVDSALSLLLGS